jgi:Amt family ammonium transporter
MAVGLKFRFGYDDSLDVVGVHLVAGLWGTVGAGLLSTSTGLFYGKGLDQTIIQIVIALASLVITGVVTTVIALALKATMGWRIPADAETAGIDTAEHAETAYDLVSRGGRAGVSGSGPSPRRPPPHREPLPEGAKCMKLVTAIIKPHQLDDRQGTPWRPTGSPA